jgi:hypothetical protein
MYDLEMFREAEKLGHVNFRILGIQMISLFQILGANKNWEIGHNLQPPEFNIEPTFSEIPTTIFVEMLQLVGSKIVGGSDLKSSVKSSEFPQVGEK